MRDVYKGHITSDIISKEVPRSSNAHYMVSGPPVMVKAIQKALITIDIPENRIRTDVFLGYD